MSVSPTSLEGVLERITFESEENGFPSSSSKVAKWSRTPGFTSDADGRAFAQALARKRVRLAFPDSFTDLAKKLQGRLADQHERNTDEGRGLRSLREIRVQASSVGSDPLDLDHLSSRREPSAPV